MSTRKRTYFQLPDTISVATVTRWLKRSIKCKKVGAYRCRHTFLDSFDSRLYRAGIILELETVGDTLVVQRYSLTDGSVGEALSVICPPRFSGDFPPGVLRQELRALLNVRALLPVAERSSHVVHFSVLNKTGSEVFRILIDTPVINSADDKARPILYLESDKDQGKPHSKIVRRLARQFPVNPVPLPLMMTAMKANSYQPAEYSSSFSVDLIGKMRADVALRAILTRLFDILLANGEGVIANLDTEFLHDYRVAIRRMRSIISSINGVIVESRRKDVIDDLVWLGEITGPSRDMDVYLLKIPDLSELLPLSLRNHIEPLRVYLEKNALVTHKQLVDQFKSERYQAVIKNWRQLLATMDFRKRPAVHASQPIVGIAGRSIWNRYKKVIRQGRAINDDSPSEMLHNLRKSCKKLRYLLDAFSSLYPKKEMKRVVSQLKALQNLLGEYQDYHMHAKTLRYFGKQMHEEMEINDFTDRAITMLSEGFDAKQEILCRDIIAHFSGFATNDHYHHFKKLFKPEIIAG